MSRPQSAVVDQALKLIANGLTPYAAAKKTGIALSTIYRAQKRQKKTTARKRRLVYYKGTSGTSKPTPSPDESVLTGDISLKLKRPKKADF